MRNHVIPRSTSFILWAICLGSVALAMSRHIDLLSGIILIMVTFLGAVVGQYSLRYLEGEKHINSFFVKLAFTIIAVSTLVVSTNLIVFLLAWFAMSMGLHGLLLFYPDRPLAVLAARKKFIISRTGDVFLMIAIGLIYKAFGTFEFDQIFSACSGILSDSQSNLVSWSGVFFAAGAMTKSAQVPFHFWLPETMETPTPVSALMHAGIINAGGFLILRLSPIMSHAAFASLMLASVGALTAVFGSLVMVTQNDIKKKLAYSTISQMGMMMFACGIGAYTFALFHIVSHSLYKAYAFLSTGDLVEENRKLSVALEPFTSFKLFLFISFGAAIVFTGLVFNQGLFLPEFTYVSVLFLGFAQNAESLDRYSSMKPMAWLKIGIKITAAIALFVGLESILRLNVEDLLSLNRSSIAIESPLFVVCFASYLIFASGFWIGNVLMNPLSQLSKRVYFYMWNGGYFGVHKC